MLSLQTAPIKHWIETMGFELVKSDFFQDTLINYYSLGNFGVFEEIIDLSNELQLTDKIETKYISWNPWGVDFQVNSVIELSEAYDESLSVSPELDS